MIPPASRHCFHCDQDVCYTFLPVDEAETTCVEFKICGFHKRYQKIAVKKNIRSLSTTYTCLTLKSGMATMMI